MFEQITLAEIGGLIIFIGAVTGVIVTFLRPIKRLFSDVDKLKMTVYGGNGNETVLATKKDVTGIQSAIQNLADATNLMYQALIAVIENQPDNKELNKIKEQLNTHKGIV